MERGSATPRFGRMVTAMVTPFDGAGALDVDGAVRLARWLTDNGSDGLVVAGTTGEGPVLTDEEDRILWEAVVQAVTVPVVAGTGSNDTAHSIELTRMAAQCGVAGALVVTPYYNRPSQAGIAAHFEAVAASTDLPVLLYDVPARTGRRIDVDTTLRLAQVPNIVGIKDAGGDLVASTKLIARAPASFEHYSGDDALTLALMGVGSLGVISVAGHWAGVEMAEMIHCFVKGDLDSARQINARLISSYEFESSEVYPNPLPAKAALRALGLPAGQCRLPMGPAPAGLDDWAAAVLGSLGRSLDGAAGAGDSVG